jgi:hypothetical protein
MLRRNFATATIAFVLSMLAATDATAAGQRSFVSGFGADVGGCSPSAPCRSFGYAITQTTSGGEVIVLDSAGYGSVTITQSVSIIAPPGVYAGITVFSGNGVSINAGASDAVTLRGLSVTGLGGTVGISFSGGASLIVVDCTVTGFTQQGLLFSPVATTSNALVERSVFARNATGVLVSPTGNLTVRDSIVSNHSGNGIYIFGIASSGGATLTVVDSLLNGNAVGLNSDTNSGGPSHIRIAGNRITNNSTGIRIGGFSDATSIGNNMIRGNGTDKAGSPTIVAGD